MANTSYLLANALTSLASGIALPSSERATVDKAVAALNKDAAKDAKKAPKNEAPVAKEEPTNE